MRIVIDMQGAQTESRFRGVGRYTLSFAQAILRNRKEHEVYLALSGLFPDTIASIRTAFYGLLPQENIRVWHAPTPVLEGQPGNDSRRETAELVREAFLLSLRPDIIHISSLFESYMDDAVTSIGRFDTDTPVSVILYDLIPLLSPDHYLNPDQRYEQYYLRKVKFLKQAALRLAISDFSAAEGVSALCVPKDSIVSISTAIETHFRPHTTDDATASQLLNKFGISRPFVLYTGGADLRKNLPRLIEAYAALPADIRDRHQLLFVGKMPKGDIVRFKQLARAARLKTDELIFTGYVSDEELVQFYNLSQLYVFPSWHEGFGLPALEAMACGAPVIAANTSSLPDVIGLDEALFDPFDVSAIANKMAQVLQDEAFRLRLRKHCLQQACKFSWDETAKRAISAWEKLPFRSARKTDYLAQSHTYNRFLDAMSTCVDTSDKAGLVALSQCIALNESAGIERQLLLDVSKLCQCDAATDALRIANNYLKGLLQSPPAGFRVEPVYATQEEGYRYAQHFTARFLGQDDAQASDEAVRWQRGDLFFGLDTQQQAQLAHASFFRQLQQEGVVVKFLVHDVLPIELKDLDAKTLHEQCLTMIATTDGAVCICKATADAFDAWVLEHAVPRAPTFRTSWIHNGKYIEGSQHTRSLPDDAAFIQQTLHQHQTSSGIPWSTWQQSTEKLKVSLVEQNYPRQQLLVDISELVQRDARSGIQRVVRSILKEWLLNPPDSYRVEPVYATVEQGYRYARHFTQRFMGTDNGTLPDEPIDYAPGDIYLGLDLQPQIQVAQRSLYQTLRRQGIYVYFLVHDLLSIQMPQHFPPGSKEGFSLWLNVVAESDGAVCVSETTAIDLEKWIKDNIDPRLPPFRITWSHNGADVASSHPSQGCPPDAEATLDQIRAHPSFLMVGTLEPRKGHAQVLDAFELLWRTGVYFSLVIIGKQGWMADKFITRLRTHSEFNKHLFWLEGISDEFLEKVYTASTCLIAASYGEGFGLPLIEAAKHKLPIIARDIPVFREVAGEYAYYFDAITAEQLATAIRNWDLLYKEGQHPRSEAMPWLTWKECACQLSNMILSNNCYSQPIAIQQST